MNKKVILKNLWKCEMEDSKDDAVQPINNRWQEL